MPSIYRVPATIHAQNPRRTRNIFSKKNDGDKPLNTTMLHFNLLPAGETERDLNAFGLRIYIFTIYARYFFHGSLAKNVGRIEE